MNKKMLIPACLSFLALSLAACGGDSSPTNNPDPSVPAHSHNWESAWEHDDTNHWHACKDSSCNEVNGKVAHSGGTATCLEKAKCDVCGVEYGELASHTYPETWTCTAVGHYKTCTVEGCGVKTELASHTGGTATCTAKGICSECGEPYGSLSSHTWQESTEVEGALKSEATCETKATYFKSCAVCGTLSDETFEIGELKAHSGGTATCESLAICDVCEKPYGEYAAHTGGTATCQNKAVCDVCEKPYGELATTHVWNEEVYVKSAEGHYHPCKEEGCDAHSELENHEPGPEATETEPQKCIKCEYIIVPATGHVVANPKEQWSSNNEEHWKECEDCEDSAHITEKGAHVAATPATCTTPAICGTCNLPYGSALGHNYDYSSATITEIPTAAVDGKATINCTGCTDKFEIKLPASSTGYSASFELYNDGANARFVLAVESSFIPTVVESNPELDAEKLSAALSDFSENRDPSVFGYSYLLVVNGKLLSTDFILNNGDNKAEISCELSANDKVVFYNGNSRVNFAAGGSAIEQGGHEFTAATDGAYSFYLNNAGQLWYTSTVIVKQYDTYTLYVNGTANDAASVVPTGTDFAKFEVTLSVGDVVTIKGDDTLLSFNSDATQFTATLEGAHTFYVNNENKVYPTMPASGNEISLYLVPNGNWKADNARFAAYFFGNGETWVSMTDENADGVYEVVAPAGYTSVIFCRMNPSASANNWDNKWNQTADLTVPTDNKVQYNIPEGTWDNPNGSWTEFGGTTEEDPIDPTPTPGEGITVYYYNKDWTNVNAYVWNVDPLVAWPGKAMTAVEGKTGWYSIEIEVKDLTGYNIIFNNGSAQTPDIAIDPAKLYFYNNSSEGCTSFAEAEENASTTVTVWGIVGSGITGAGNWSNDVVMTANNGIYEATIVVASSAEFKIRKDYGWDENYGGTLSNGTVKGVQNGSNIKLGAGTYLVQFDPSTKVITITKQ